MTKIKEADSHVCMSLQDIVKLSLNTPFSLSSIISSEYEELIFDNSPIESSLKVKYILYKIYQYYSLSNIDPHVMFETF